MALGTLSVLAGLWEKLGTLGMQFPTDTSTGPQWSLQLGGRVGEEGGLLEALTVVALIASGELTQSAKGTLFSVNKAERRHVGI